MDTKMREREETYKLVSVKMLAQDWNASKSTVRRLLRQGGVKGYRLGPKDRGTIRFRKSDIERFLEKSKEP